ncbi:hypothetical protein BZG36_03212 [Bifiguratus adelaidae]|uniref:Isoaspartyl peptidase/L-asparaginase n=1 Tax=Bifiguratus adelaidae TaxID=1938954 RepID=A0A261Y175_9FUNG|nr:hypothetical protein BZG36_03212 [Bifiguratus adelaidae]
MGISKITPGIVVHGGAWDIPDDLVEKHLKGVEAACNLGNTLIHNNEPAIDICQKVIELLEDDPTFDCAVGSFLNDESQVEMDAIIGDDKYNFGAVAGIKNVAHPIQVARAVRDHTKHVLLVGDGANKLAREVGIPSVPTESLLVGRELDRYHHIHDDLEHFEIKREFGTVWEADKDVDANKTLDMPSDTVGVIVRDKMGSLAVGLSTGGTPFKRAGRVGDTPIWGAGAYAVGNSAAASSGYGEDLLRATMAKSVVDEIRRRPTSAVTAAQYGVENMSHTVGGLGGVIAFDAEGNVGIAFNTHR